MPFLCCCYNKCAVLLKRKPCCMGSSVTRVQKTPLIKACDQIKQLYGVYNVLSQKEFTSRHSRSPGTSGIILVLELEDQRKQGANIYLRLSRCLNQNNDYNSGILYFSPFRAHSSGRVNVICLKMRELQISSGYC